MTGRLRVRVGHSEGGQQILLALGFAAQVLGEYFAAMNLSVCGTPLVVVHAIQDAGHGGSAVAQHAFQAETEFRGLDFLAVLAC